MDRFGSPQKGLNILFAVMVIRIRRLLTTMPMDRLRNRGRFETMTTTQFRIREPSPRWGKGCLDFAGRGSEFESPFLNDSLINNKPL